MYGIPASRSSESEAIAVSLTVNHEEELSGWAFPATERRLQPSSTRHVSAQPPSRHLPEDEVGAAQSSRETQQLLEERPK